MTIAQLVRSNLEHQLKVSATDTSSKESSNVVLLRTPVLRSPFVFCLPSHTASTAWKKLLIASLTGKKTHRPHFFLSELEKNRVSFGVVSSEVVAHSPEASRFILVRDPYARLLSMYLRRVVHRPEPRAWPRGLRRSDNFSEFTRRLLATPVSRRSTVFAPVAVSQRDCMLARPTPLRVEVQNQWYGEILQKLELGGAAAEERMWGENRCFYRPCRAPCKDLIFNHSNAHRFKNCWTSITTDDGSGDFGLNRTVTLAAMRKHYADALTVARATKIMEPDLLAFGYPRMIRPARHTKRAPRRNRKGDMNRGWDSFI